MHSPIRTAEGRINMTVIFDRISPRIELRPYNYGLRQANLAYYMYVYASLY